MRVAKKEIKEPDVINGLLAQCRVGRLGTVGKDSFPMIKPLNFVYWEGKLYFHSACEGEKIEHIRRDSRVCFEVDLPIGYVKSLSSPCKADFLYRSLIIKGYARIVEERPERLSVLRALMEKYQPEGGYGDFIEEKLALTTVVGIDIGTITGKEDIGKEHEKEIVLEYLKQHSCQHGILERT